MGSLTSWIVNFGYVFFVGAVMWLVTEGRRTKNFSVTKAIVMLVGLAGIVGLVVLTEMEKNSVEASSALSRSDKAPPSEVSREAERLAWVEKNVKPLLAKQQAVFTRLDQAKAELVAAQAEFRVINAELDTRHRELRRLFVDAPLPQNDQAKK